MIPLRPSFFKLFGFFQALGMPEEDMQTLKKRQPWLHRLPCFLWIFEACCPNKNPRRGRVSFSNLLQRGEFAAQLR